MKRKLLVLMAILMAAVTSAWAEVEVTVGCLTFQIDETNNCATVSKAKNASIPSDGSVEIPATVNYGETDYPVTKIGKSAFSYCLNMKSLTFASNSNLVEIGEEAIAECGSLTSVELPNSLTTIGNYAFSKCTGLTSIVIPSGVSSIGQAAFANCSNLTSANIPEGVITIEKETFTGCKFETIEIPSTVTSIGENAFSYGNLTSLTIPGNVKELGKFAFYSTCLTSVTIEEGLTKIGEGAFSWCPYMKSIELPKNSLKTIEKGAFNECKALQSITIPNSVESIGQSAFWDCIELKSVKLPENPKYTELSASLFYQCYCLRSFTIPSQITSIGSEAFNKCKNLNRLYVTTPIVPTVYQYSLSGMGNNLVIFVRRNMIDDFKDADYWKDKTFEGFKNYIKYYTTSEPAIEIDKTADFGTDVVFLTNDIDGTENGYNVGYIDFSDKPTKIPANLFSGKTALTGIEIPSSIVSIGENAFKDCANLSKLTFFTPSKPAIAESAFAGTSSLSEVYVREVASRSFAEDEMWSGKTLKTFNNIKYRTEDNKALDITALPNFGENVQFIGDFYDLENGGYLEYLGEVTEIPYHGFYNYTNITEITIPATVTKLGSNIFSGNKLQTVYFLPKDVPTYDRSANTFRPIACSTNGSTFYYRSTLKDYDHFNDLVYAKNLKQFAEVRYTSDDSKAVTPEVTTGYGTDAKYVASFYDYGTEDNKYGCLLFAGDVTEIPGGAFAGTELKEVRIPETVTAFGDNVFSGCENLESVILLSSTPAETVSTSTFTNSTTTENLATVYVRKSALVNYSAATNWDGITVKSFPYIKYTTKGNEGIDRHDWSKTHFPANVEYLGSKLDGTTDDNGHKVGYMEFLGVMTEIPQDLFHGKEDLTSVTIPKEITKVGNGAFSGCTSLASVSFEEGSLLTEIEENAFNETRMTSLQLPNSVTKIGNRAFYNCYTLTSIHLPTNVTSIGSQAFDVKNTGSRFIYVTELTYDGTLEQWCAINFGDEESNPLWRFHGKGTVKKSNGTDVLIGNALEIPSSVTEIKDYTFYCADITSVNLGKVTKVGTKSFAYTDMQTLKINDELTEIGDEAFRDANITSLDLNHVATIGKKAFSNCMSLTSLTLSDELTEIGESTFFYSKIASLDLKNVTKIGKDAFHGCSQLATLTMNKELEELGENAFEDAKIKTLNYNIEDAETLTNKPYDATTLTTVTIGENVKTIPEGAFASSLITTIDIPESVTKIGADAFDGCTKLASAKYTGSLAQWCGITFGNAAANPMSLMTAGTGTVKNASNADLFTNELTITVEEVKSYSFVNSNITSLNIGNATTIGDEAFKGCSNLATLTLNTDVQTIGDDAFSGTNIATLNYNIENAATLTAKPYDATKLTAVTIGANVQTIPTSAFAGSQISTITIPASVTAIGEDAFADVTLTDITYGRTFDKWCAIDFGSAAANPMSCMTAGSANVKNSDDEAIIPTALSLTGTAVKPYTYVNSNITSLNIGNATTIGDEAFSGCSSLATINAGLSPATLGTDAFSGINENHAVNVSLNSYFDYKKANGWKDLTLVPQSGTLALTDEIEYTIGTELTGCTLSYTRTFKNDKWQALFLPFAMSYDDWSEKGQMAELTGVDDGVLEWTILESGSQTEAGKPYIFRPNAFNTSEVEDGREIVFSVTGTLASCDAKTSVTPNLKGTETPSGYTLSGTYTEKTDMASTTAYALANGDFYYTTNTEKTLKPYRIFLTIPSPSAAPVRNRINGEDVTGIEELTIDVDLDFDFDRAYNLSGQKVGKDYRGIVIENGKKVMRK